MPEPKTPPPAKRYVAPVLLALGTLAMENAAWANPTTVTMTTT